MGARFLEFFAGGGMARAGLGPKWRCAFANDVDPKKCAAYAANWGTEDIRQGDVGALRAADLPEGRPELAWASFPCQDLSLAGARAGLSGARSGSFAPFWALIEALATQRRAPDLVVLENVQGALTSAGGADFTTLCARLAGTGYVFGAMIVDAAHFVPQSRPRLFILAARQELGLPDATRGAGPSLWHPAAVRRGFAALPAELKELFVWWRMPPPPPLETTLADIVEEHAAIEWRPDVETARLLTLMSEANLRKLHAARMLAARGKRVVGTAYRRTRTDAAGVRRQRAEARFDGLAGCLRTPAGGSSRQLILAIENHRTRSRLITARETARLMGLPDSFVLPSVYNEAYHLTGDGVVVPVVRYLSRHLLEPILAARPCAGLTAP